MLLQFARAGIAALFLVYTAYAAEAVSSSITHFANPGLPEDLLDLCLTPSCETKELLRIESIDVAGPYITVNLEAHTPVTVVAQSPAHALEIARALENFQEVQLEVRPKNDGFELVGVFLD